MSASPLASSLVSVREGWSLPSEAYLADATFAADMALLSRRWTFAGHVSEVGRPGSWILARLGDEEAIIVRGEDGALRALANVCRHRGSRVCVASRGVSRLFTCPYHAWSYRLDGSLQAAREMPEDFDPADFGLKPLPLVEIGGLIFVTFTPDFASLEPPSLDLARPALEALTARLGWREAKIAHREAYEVAANWKLVMENYHECYHCGPAHPEFAQLHALARPGARGLTGAPDPLTGLADLEDWGIDGLERETVRVMRSQLSADCATGSREGAPLAPPMGPSPALWGHCVFAELGYLSAFLAYADHGVIYRFEPLAPLRTRMEVIWLTSGAAREGEDYDVEALSWLWRVTSEADKTIIERNQAGVKSRAYEPGPFSGMEPGTRQYVARYLADLARVTRTP
ncbi:MAG: aromatic ring-hydroxylating dioxygenase subunit alpha [Alphaproteobacteria bacterium]|nr:aromatic ring-hydroxylating dioxygenase subunit alpha [Alphaproteobacteria bacterium]